MYTTNKTAKLRRIDEESLRELLSHINNWKQRKAAKEGMLAPSGTDVRLGK